MNDNDPIAGEYDNDEHEHRDPLLDSMVDDLEMDLFESESDAVTVEQFRSAWEKTLDHPALEFLARMAEIGPDLLRGLARTLTSTDTERPIDEYGCDQRFLDSLYPFARWLHDQYFRCESRGVEHVPDSGRVLLVANHSGVLPYDGAAITTALRVRHPCHRMVRPLVENFLYHMPYLGLFMARIGAVRACQENAERLLENDDAVLVFPEGVKGIGKLYKHRYRLQRFGRGGAIKLAMRTRSPIVPVAVTGAEESMPLLFKTTWLAKPLGLPYIPVTPTLPALGLAGAIPLPTKWYIDFGEPLDMARYGPEALTDRVLINRLNEQVRATIQEMIDRRLEERQSVWYG